MVHAYLLLVIAAANDMFNLLPGGDTRAGGANTQDIGLLLIALGLIYYVLRHHDLKPLANFFTWWVVYYLALIGVQISLASILYSQSIMDGMMAARHQLYYLSFPLFLFALNDLQKIKTFMKVFGGLAIFLVIISMINYSGLTLFYHIRAEGQGVRSGIVRAYIPALSILVMAALWQFWAYLKEERLFTGHLVAFLIIFGGVVFRQTRGRIIAVFLTLVLMLLAKRRYKLLAGGSLLLVVGLVGQAFLGEESILLNAFESAYTDVAHGEGTWHDRMLQMQASWNVFVDNFMTGSGGLVIRQGEGGWAGWGDLLDVAFSADLGYWTWLKFFGYPGMVYLIALVLGFYWYVFRCGSLGEQGHLGRFAAYHFTCVLISMVTINYLTQPEGIVLLCLTWAVLVRAAQATSKDATSLIRAEAEFTEEDLNLQEPPPYAVQHNSDGNGMP